MYVGAVTDDADTVSIHFQYSIHRGCHIRATLSGVSNILSSLVVTWPDTVLLMYLFIASVAHYLMI